jgi:hypothetical protein
MKMAWTKTQKQIAVRACIAAKIGEEQRRDMILRHFANARMQDGRISSTAPNLSNRDYEQFMAIVENYAGGQVLHFTRGYWSKCAADQHARLRFRVRNINDSLVAAGLFTPDGESLRGWISKRVTKGMTDRAEELDYHGLMALTLGLEAFASRNRVAVGVMDDAPLQSTSTAVRN